MEDTSKGKNSKPKEEDEEKMKKEAMDELNKMIFKKSGGKKDENKEEWQFWDKQPVPKLKSFDVKDEDIGPIEKDNDVEKERKEPYPLPKNCSWYNLDINDTKDLTTVRRR